MSSVTFIATNFVPAAPRLRTMTARSLEQSDSAQKTTNYVVSYGNIKQMERTDPTEDSINGITNLITQHYMKGRYNHVITLSLYNPMDTLENVAISALDNTFDTIDSSFLEQYPILYVCIIPRQIYTNHGEIGEQLADNAATMLNRYGFIDIGCKIHEGLEIPKYVLVRANDIGSSGIVENFNEFW